MGQKLITGRQRITQMDDRKIIGADKGEKNYKITVTGRGEEIILNCMEKENLLEAMTRQGIYMSAACGGRGTCGKCKIQLIEGNLKITSSDKKVFSKDELNDGCRLSCQAYPEADLTIKLTAGDEADFEVVTDLGRTSQQKRKKDDSYAIAIDIGTTTIAISLIEVTSGDNLWTYTTVNKQRAYGADVIARMQASNNGKKQELRECIQKDLLSGIQAVVAKTGIEKEQIQKLAIAGNTTMGHLLLGYSCETLGIFPFTPVNINTIVLPFEEVLESDYLKIPVILLPGISTYVGADIAAGLLACDYDRAEKPSLLIDLGTNGEMAIGNKDKILVSSTAAGPAFEGGNISCGVGSIAGAICNIEGVGDQLTFKTIGDKPPVGICGTGVIEIVSELVKAGLVDETGLLDEEYFETGYQIAEDNAGNKINFTQRDVREIQLAKAAVRAGIEILVRRYGVGYEEIDTVYLAGGFGYKINIGKAIEVGLLPKELEGKIKAIGNSSLGGAVKYLTQNNTPDRMKHIIETSDEINLSNDKDFNDLYVEYMYFE